MDLNRSQLSLIITFFSLSIVILLLFNIHLGSEEQEEYIIELSLADEELEKIIEELERQEEMAKADPIKSHMAFNETAKSSLEEPEPLKTLEELLEEKEASMNEDDFKEFLNPDSLKRIDKAFIEPSLATATAGDSFQFQRLGYFNVDPDSTNEKLVFNRTVALRDSWAKIQQKK